MLQAAGASFLLVAASEMGDKTQLLAFTLAARYKRPGVVLSGILLATLINHALASAAGTWLAGRVAPGALALSLGAAFIAFGFWMLKADEAGAVGESSPVGPFLTTVALFFLAEMGDKTQLATMALGARYRSVAAVTLGSTAGMMLSDGLAVFLGDRLAHGPALRWVRWGASALFFAFGATALVGGLRAWGTPR